MSVEEVLLSWAEITPALVVNRPGDMAGNTSKPYQSRAIRELGFHTPETLVTTDAEAAFEFMARHGEVVYKSISGVRSVVSRLNERDRARLATELRWCPTQFQRYVPGTDYRVHVVGRRTFACSIRSAADDYRYAADASGLNMNACDLPQELTEACVRLAQALKLWVAGIDLRLSPEGEWVCFEVNPSPGFSFFADAAGQPIAAAIAELLIEGLASVPAL